MKRISIIMGTLLLTSCATQKNVSLNESFWEQKQRKVAVAAVKPQQPQLHKVGSQGILDYAINSAMTNKLDTQMNKTDLGWYYSLPEELSVRLKSNKINAVVAGNNVANEQKYLANLAARNNADDILVLELSASGAIRSYSGFIPNGAPQAFCQLKGELIDPTTKAVKWRHQAEIKVPVQGEWDQPPAYPNVTASVKEAIKLCKQEVMDSFFSGRA